MLIIVYEKNCDKYHGIKVPISPTTKPWDECRLWVAYIYAPKPDDKAMTLAPIYNMSWVKRSTIKS